MLDSTIVPELPEDAKTKAGVHRKTPWAGKSVLDSTIVPELPEDAKTKAVVHRKNNPWAAKNAMMFSDDLSEVTQIHCHENAQISSCVQVSKYIELGYCTIFCSITWSLYLGNCKLNRICTS